MNNNEAFISTLKNIRPIEGADKIKLADVTLNNIPITQIVVGADTQEGLKVVYFDSNMALEDSTIEALDKVSVGYGKEDFTSVGKYLAKGNRVKVVKLRQQISNGLAIEVAKFFQFFKSESEAMKTLIEGFSFTELNGIKICHKWLPPVRNQNSGKGNKEHKGKKKVSRIIPELFHFHVDTQQLARNVHNIKPTDVISLSKKFHGTSAICSHTKVLKKLSVIDKIFNFLKLPVEKTEWDYLYASRSVIKNEAEGTGFYKVDLWTEVGKKCFENRLHKGETVYYEIVGYLPNTSSFIQKHFDYGCNIGEYKVKVYRITSTNEDGVVFEYSWQAMKERCVELNVEHVEEFFFGRAKDLYPELSTEEHWHENFLANLKRDYLEKDLTINKIKKVPDEGVVLRVEAKDIQVYKLKSEKFFAFESSAKEDENNVDLEEQEEAASE